LNMLEIKGDELLELTSEPLDVKEELSLKIIEEVHKRFNGRVMVSWSGGKDSTIVVYLARKIDPNVIVLFANTLIEYPETVKYVRELAKEWKLNYHEVKPRKGVTYWKIVEREGFPKIRWHRHKPTCCTELKTYPIQVFTAKMGIKCQLIGFTYDESRPRFVQLYRNGIFQYVKPRKYEDVVTVYKCYPIAFWSVSDVWKYIKKNNIPYNPVYDKGVERVGCMPCTAHLGWRESLGRTNPKMLEFILRKMREMGDERGYQTSMEDYVI